MKVLCGIFTSWSHCISQFCQPISLDLDEKSRGCDDLNDSSFHIVQDEPSFMPRPSAVPLRNTPEVRGGERPTRKRRGSSGWGSLIPGKRLLAFNNTSSPRRPRISPPSNFRHVYSESFHFQGSTSSQFQLHSQSQPQLSSFRPLELGFTASDTRLSPILPHLDDCSPPVTPPPKVYTTSSPGNAGSLAIYHQRNRSAASFTIPRRPVNGSFVYEAPPSHANTPQKPQAARTRAYGSSSPPPPPIMEDLVERVAHAMLERDKIQDQIDDIVERQTLYTSSRPSTADEPTSLGLDQSLAMRPVMRPMSEVPALPPNAPSFSERLGSDHARSTSTRSPTRPQYRANSSRKMGGRAPPPPLPLRLRPPLRKKKSFSGMSNWLYPTVHTREVSLDSVTNTPGPVTSAKGFYQVARPELDRRSSFDSESIVSDWTVEEPTMMTSLSPSSAATPKATAGPPMGLPLGLQEPIRFSYRRGVGIAF